MEDVKNAVLRRMNWRIIPLILVSHLILHIDRQNVGFAALTMNASIGLNAEMFGFGAGIFFWGYAIFEVPSNLILSKVGAPLWIGRIMVTWGIVVLALSLVQGPTAFYILRFLLGAAEAGFSPGIIYYCAQWYPKANRGTPLGFWMMGPSLAAIIGGPLAAALMSLDWFQIAGWRWMFALEALPPIALGIALPFILPRDIQTASFLTQPERDMLHAELAREAGEKTDHAQNHFSRALLSPPLWIYTFTFFCISICFYSLYFWLPQVLKAGFSSLSTMQVGLLSSLPYCITLVSSILIVRHSDQTGDRRWHLCTLGLIATVGLLVGGYVTDPILSYAAVTVAICCAWAYLTLFNVVPTTLLAGTAAAGGLAFINAIGNLGGFFGPYMIGALKQQTGSFAGGISALAVFVVLMALIPVVFPRLFQRVRPRHATPPLELHSQPSAGL